MPSAISLFSFSLKVSEPEVASFREMLHPEELERADRALLPDVQRRFIVGRGMMRSLLAERVHVSPRELRFTMETFGKPSLPDYPDLHFNMSHSVEHALLAIHDQPVGVDIESLQRSVNAEAIASQVLSARELAMWGQLPEASKKSTLLATWVAKESILKLLGVGLTESMTGLELPMPLAVQPCQVAIPDRYLMKSLAIERQIPIARRALASAGSAHGKDEETIWVQPIEITSEVIASLATATPAPIQLVTSKVA